MAKHPKTSRTDKTHLQLTCKTLFSKKTHANQRSFLDDSMATSNHKPNVWAKDGKKSGRSGASSQVFPSSIR